MHIHMRIGQMVLMIKKYILVTKIPLPFTHKSKQTSNVLSEDIGDNDRDIISTLN